MPFVRIAPEQMMRYWPQVKECIASALPPLVRESDEAMLKVQEHLLLGLMDCWLMGGPDIIYGVVTTRVVLDDMTGAKNMLVFSVATIEHHPYEMWAECIEILRKYADAKGCDFIMAFSQNPRMIKIAESIGCDARWRLLYYPVR